MDVYVLARTPGATETVEWEEVYRKAPFVFVNHQTLRTEGKWTCHYRARPFEVAVWRGGFWSTMSWHKTLQLALKAANRLAKQLTERK
jgi:hypothetical protein